jgi:hypothetical protein
MTVKKKQYGMVQLPEDVHQRLRDFCKEHGFQIGGFVAALIRQSLANNERKQWNKD